MEGDLLDLNKYIKQQLEDLDISLIVKQEVREQVRSDIARELKVIVREQIDRIITDEVNLILKEGVTVSTGYGEPTVYKSFENFFKSEFQKRMNKDYDMKKIIELGVKAKVASLFNTQVDGAIKEIIAKLTKELK